MLKCMHADCERNQQYRGLCTHHHRLLNRVLCKLRKPERAVEEARLIEAGLLLPAKRSPWYNAVEEVRR